jgi:DNA-directed RNA polymerase subunit H
LSVKTKARAISHELVPKHEVLSDAEKQKLLSKMTMQQLPRIKMSDAAISELEAKPGDIIKITRKDSTEENIHYRQVVQN